MTKTIDPVAAAATKTEDAGGAKMAMTIGVTTPTARRSTMTANGVFDQDQGDLTMDMSDALGAAGLSERERTVELRYLEENGDPVIYLNMPFLSSKLPGGQAWIRLDLEKAGQEPRRRPQPADRARPARTPATLLDMLRASGSVERGRARRRSTATRRRTTRRRSTSPRPPAARRHRAQALVQSLIAQGAPSSIPVDVWIGDDGLVRKRRRWTRA